MKLVVRKNIVTEIDDKATGLMARAVRKKNHISLRRLAKHMGFSAPYISDLELGRRSWNDDLLKKYDYAIIAIGDPTLIPRIIRATKRAHRQVFKLD